MGVPCFRVSDQEEKDLGNPLSHILKPFDTDERQVEFSAQADDWSQVSLVQRHSHSKTSLLYACCPFILFNMPGGTE